MTVPETQTYPVVLQVVLDCSDARRLAEFYRQLLGLRYRPGDEPPAAGDRRSGRCGLAGTPAGERPLYVVADPAGHPFCIFVG